MPRPFGVHRDTLNRVLLDNPESLVSILKALVGGLEKESHVESPVQLEIKIDDGKAMRLS